MTGDVRLWKLTKTYMKALATGISLAGSGCEFAQRDPHCDPCQISLDTVVVLRDSGVSTAFFSSVRVARSHANGRLAVVPRSNAGVIAVYDSSGQLRTQLGRRGGGPGEYRRIAAVFFDPFDSLRVIDTGNGRLDVFGPDNKLARSQPFAGGVRNAAPLQDGSILIQAISRTSGVAQYRARLLRPGGNLLQVAPIANAYTVADVGWDDYPVTAVEHGGFWIVGAYSRAFEEYSSSGELLRRFVTIPDWFKQAELSAGLEAYIDPRPAVDAITSSRDGRLWVLNIIPQVPHAIPTFEPDRPPDQAFVSQFADYVLEVIEPASAQTLAARRFDDLPLDFLNDGFAYYAAELSSGEVIVVVVALRLG